MNFNLLLLLVLIIVSIILLALMTRGSESFQTNKVSMVFIATNMNIIDCGDEYWNYNKTGFCSTIKNTHLNKDAFKESLDNFKKTFTFLKSQTYTKFKWIVFYSSYMSPLFLKELETYISSDDDMKKKIKLVRAPSISHKEKFLDQHIRSRKNYVLMRLSNGFTTPKSDSNYLQSLIDEKDKFYHVNEEEQS